MREGSDEGRGTVSWKEGLGRQEVGLMQLWVVFGAGRGRGAGVSQLACEAAGAGDSQGRSEKRK